MKGKKEKDLEFDYEAALKKVKKFEDTMTCAICSIGFSAATISIISLVTVCIDKSDTLPYFVAGGIIAVPFFYILLKK